MPYNRVLPKAGPGNIYWTNESKRTFGILLSGTAKIPAFGNTWPSGCEKTSFIFLISLYNAFRVYR
jgi:hypothetical protein